MTPPEPEPEAITSIADYCAICKPLCRETPALSTLLYHLPYLTFIILLSEVVPMKVSGNP